MFSGIAPITDVIEPCRHFRVVPEGKRFQLKTVRRTSVAPAP